jgi:hypothetical protein
MANMNGFPVLCRGIIELALLDAANSAARQRNAGVNADDARAFLAGGWCAALCEAAGLDYNVLIVGAASVPEAGHA